MTQMLPAQNTIKCAISNETPKCDEAKLPYYNCQQRKLTYSFLQYVPLPSRSQHPRPGRTHESQILSPALQALSSRLTSPAPNNALSSLPLQFNILDLELLHFYTTTTGHEMLGHHMTGTDIWRTSVVTRAFQHPFLLSSLFSLSALHLAFLHSDNTARNQKYGQIATRHHLKCISIFRIEVQRLTPENSEACCACALQLALHAWAKPGGRGADLFFPMAEDGKRDPVPWYKLHRGGVEVLKSAMHWVENGELRDLVQPWKRIRLPLQPQIVLMEDGPTSDQRKLDSVSSCWNQEKSVLCSEEKLTLDETLSTLRYVFTLSSLLSSESFFSSEVSISSCFATLLWTTMIPPRFCEMVEERCPQALIIVATYCILLKWVEKFWWIKGKAENLLRTVRKKLAGEQWDEWLNWPVRDVESGLVRET